MAAEDPNHTNPYMFTGRRFDVEIGLYYYRARYYDPFTGRFLQTDPIGYGDGMNWYRYCGNNPLNSVDPSGSCSMGTILLAKMLSFAKILEDMNDSEFRKFVGLINECNDMNELIARLERYSDMNDMNYPVSELHSAPAILVPHNICF